MNNSHHRNKEILWKTIHATNFVRGTPWKQLIGGCIIQPHTLCHNVLTTGYGHPLWYWDTKSCKKIANFCLLSMSSLRWQMALIGYPMLSICESSHDCAYLSRWNLVDPLIVTMVTFRNRYEAGKLMAKPLYELSEPIVRLRPAEWVEVIERKFEPQRYFEWNMMLIV